jgi:hypothetical protein
MTTIEALTERLSRTLRTPIPFGYPDAEVLITTVERALEDAKALAAELKPAYIAALRLELDRLTNGEAAHELDVLTDLLAPIPTKAEVVPVVPVAATHHCAMCATAFDTLAAFDAHPCQSAPTPERISEPAPVDGKIVCACGREFEKHAQWRGHQYRCPARVKPEPAPAVHCECGEVFATQRSLSLHRRHCTPEPIERPVAPGHRIDSEGRYECNCGRPFTQDMRDPAGRCIKCTKENP